MRSPSITTPSALTLAALGVGLALTLAGCGSSSAPTGGAGPNRSPVVAAFTATGTSGGAAFHWKARDPDGDPLTCSLDIDGDGIVDATIKRCQSAAGDTVAYPTPGPFTATLTVDDGHHHTATATADVIAAGTSTASPDWVARAGSAGVDKASGVAVDSNDDVVVAGVTNGALFGSFQGGNADAVVAKYDAAGQLIWGRHVGSADTDLANAVALDGNHDVLVTGYRIDSLGNDDTFIARYDASGTPLWDRQLGASGRNVANGIAVDSQHAIVIAGWTEGDIGGVNQGGSDAYVMKLGSAGSAILWARQPGTAQPDTANAVAVDANDDVVIAGGDVDNSAGAGGSGNGGAVTAKYDPSGTQLWLRRLGNGQHATANAVAVGANGDIAIAGDTSGDVEGTNQGADDALLAKYDSSGTLLWARQYGTADNERLLGVAIDAAGDVVATGYRYGLVATNQYGWMATTVKYDPHGTRIWLREIHDASVQSEGFGVALDSRAGIVIAGAVGGGAFAGTPDYGRFDLLAMSYPP